MARQSIPASSRSPPWKAADIITVEGLGTLDRLGALQRAFIAEQAAQCGYCIPAMIMRAQALLQKKAGADRHRNSQRSAAEPVSLRNPYAHPARRAQGRE
jgi:xanthine dehydrogenase iron-sulfur cluster and FAD-binding subunit A